MSEGTFSDVTTHSMHNEIICPYAIYDQRVLRSINVFDCTLNESTDYLSTTYRRQRIFCLGCADAQADLAFTVCIAHKGLFLALSVI